MTQSHRLVAACLLFCFAVTAEAAVIYRWVDKQGRTHFGDVVPAEYRGAARALDDHAPTPTPEEQGRAIDRATRDKERAAAAPPASPARVAASAPASRSSSSVTSRRPLYAPTDKTDCDTWRLLYAESLDCFAPYRTARGATKAEAYEHCTPVSEPPVSCGRNAQ